MWHVIFLMIHTWHVTMHKSMHANTLDRLETLMTNEWSCIGHAWLSMTDRISYNKWPYRKSIRSFTKIKKNDFTSKKVVLLWRRKKMSFITWDICSCIIHAHLYIRSWFEIPMHKKAMHIEGMNNCAWKMHSRALWYG